MTLRPFATLLHKELLRFHKVALQTLLAPMVTTLLYFLIFSHVLQDHVQALPGVSYTAFLIPGLMMMSAIQNAFANSSSSLIQSKITGNLVFVLVTPITGLEFFLAFVVAAAIRGLVVAVGVWVATLAFVGLPLQHPLWVLAFALSGSAVLGALGIVAGIWADKFDEMAAFQNFIILPLSFLSGVFYSIHSLPDFWQTLSRFNPFFYMIDGFRYGFFGVSDVDPRMSLGITLGALVAVSALTLLLLARGYKLRT